MEDKDIVDLYWARSETAISETEKKYGRYCHSIAYRILENDADAEEIVNDTYLKAWNTIPPHRPDPLRPYVGMIARQLSYNAYEARHTQKRGGNLAYALDELVECLPDGDSGEDIGAGIALRDALNRFVWSLPQTAQTVFMRRYWYVDTISEIAEAYGMSENHVSVFLYNTRQKLKKHLSKEGFTV